MEKTIQNRALITGGLGFFGSALVQRLQSTGVTCRIFDISENQDYLGSVECVRGDICDFDAIKSACAGVDVVYHNVAQVPLAKNISEFSRVNIDGTKNVLEAALACGVKKFVYTSSSAVFGVPAKNPVDETVVPTPGEAYGAAKYEGELLCNEYIKAGLDVTIVRPRTIIGHGRLGIFQVLFEWISEGRNVPVLGNGSNIYQFVHSDDLADACILAGELPGSSTFNCGAEEFGSMRGVLESLCEHAGTGSKVVSVPMGIATFGMNITSKLGLSPLGPYHSLMYGRSMYFDINKAKSELGWTPLYSNTEMFKQAYDWYLQNRDILNANSGSRSPHRSPIKQGILGVVKWII
jgi:nucleoside-diphosphate-sugar epimerase